MKLAMILVASCLVACARPPRNLAGEYSRVDVREAQQNPRKGEAVRWGGTIVSMKPEKAQTCFEVAAFPLDREARPVPSDESSGRFFACAPGFYEPAVYVGGREITLVGALNGTTVRKVGDFDYTFPRVDAASVYLWPERRPEPPPAAVYPRVGISIGGAF